MPIWTSKQAGIVYLPDRILSFFNQTINVDNTSYKFYDVTKVGDYTGDCPTVSDLQSVIPIYSLDVSSSNKKYRCLQYKIFSNSTAYPMLCPFVLLNVNNTIDVLYQANSVHADANFFKSNFVNITFWSTLKQGKTTMKTQTVKTDQQNDFSKGVIKKVSGQKRRFEYDSSLIEKINMTQVQDFQLLDQYKNIFCSARISCSKMFVSDGVDVICQDVAIIDLNPIVLDQYQSQMPVFDFAAGSDGNGSGGIGYHMHIPHIDSTPFAFAVFHPGTSMPQLPWN